MAAVDITQVSLIIMAVVDLIPVSLTKTVEVDSIPATTTSVVADLIQEFSVAMVSILVLLKSVARVNICPGGRTSPQLWRSAGRTQSRHKLTFSPQGKQIFWILMFNPFKI